MDSKRNRGFLMALVTALVGVVVLTPWVAAGSLELTLRDDVVMQGRTVPSGSYTLAWTDEKNAEQSVDLTVRLGNKVLATATGTKVALDRASDYDGVVFRTKKDGEREIVQIVFAGKKEAIRLEPAAQVALH